MTGDDPSVVNGTAFDDVGWVFEGAWSRIYNRPLDLHAAPGKQNADAHSEINGPITVYEKRNLQHTTMVLNLLTKQIANAPNVVGLELESVNEPQNNRILENCDCWDMYSYAKLIEDRDDLYRCYTSDDTKQCGEQLAASLPSKALIDGFGITKGNFVVAEFSAALNPSSLRSSEPPEQDRHRRVFAKAELECFQTSTAGFWFLAYRKDNVVMPGWSLGYSSSGDYAELFWYETGGTRTMSGGQ